MADSELSSSATGAASADAVRRAVIDVGTNSVKLLVADVSGAIVHPILEESEQTRLGRGFYETLVLQGEAIELTAEAVRHFSEKAFKTGATKVRIIATSAARDAKNATDLIKAIETKAGRPLEIISGAQEAEWVFLGVSTNPALVKTPLLILDVGGGSTEFIVGDKGHQHFRESFQLGTVRLMEQLSHSDPPTHEQLDNCLQWLRHFFLQNVEGKLKPSLQQHPGIRLVGTGGTTTILARVEQKMDSFDRDRIESTVLTLPRIQQLCSHLWSLPLAKRQTIVGLPPKRADVILFGVAIYQALMETFGFDELGVSTRGLRYAALMD